jgi:hypothetical protein
MVFRTSVPVTDAGFYNRVGERQRIAAALVSLSEGNPKWLAIIGPRRVGKTSLLLEAARSAPAGVSVIVVDVQEAMSNPLVAFRTAALRCLDATLGQEVGLSFERAALAPSDYRAALQRSRTVAGLSADLRTALLELPERALSLAALAPLLALPELIASALGVRFLLAFDEFQALLPATARGDDPSPILRSVWQRHVRTAYVISGSERSVLLDLIGSKHSPFFHHFEPLELGPFSREDSIELLVAGAPPARPIPAAIAALAFDAVSGHPFYLQLLGEVLIAQEPPYDEGSLKAALQELLFSRSGRLALFFEAEYQRVVGRSGQLVAVLDALADGPRKPADVARTIKATSGSTAHYFDRLGDGVRKLESGAYEIRDPVFRLWLAWRKPGGSVVPMSVVGNEAELEVAHALASIGFDLIYQSRRSRGAFDLLAIRGGTQMGVQVKKAELPVVFSNDDWRRMAAEAKRFGWQWVVAVVDARGSVSFLDPSRARRGKQVRLGAPAVIANLLEWVDRD